MSEIGDRVLINDLREKYMLLQERIERCEIETHNVKVELLKIKNPPFIIEPGSLKVAEESLDVSETIARYVLTGVSFVIGILVGWWIR